jgi:cathepsin F
LNLSVEQFVECDASSDPDGLDGSGCADCGVFGGWPYLAFDYAKDAGGVYQWEAWPYCVSPPRHSTLEQCWPCMADGYSKAYCGNHADFYCNASTTMGQGSAGLCKSNNGAVVQVSGWDAVTTNETEIAQVKLIFSAFAAFYITLSFFLFNKKLTCGILSC